MFPYSSTSSLVLTIAFIMGAVSSIGAARAADVDRSNDSLCDYCDDYSKLAMGGRPITSSYVPGVGYPRE